MSREEIHIVLNKLEYDVLSSSIFEDHRNHTNYIELVKLCKEDYNNFSHIKSYYWEYITWVGVELICEIGKLKLKFTSNDMADPNSLLDQIKFRLRDNKFKKISE